MPPVAPLIDTRTYDELVEQLEELARHYTEDRWRPAPAGQGLDPGGALIRLVARLGEIVIARLNRVPEKSFLAFLDLIGARLAPPRPARVPLTFHLAAGSPVDALVPAGTLTAAPPLEGGEGPALFETERALVVTRSQLVAAVVHDPGADRWSDRSNVATGSVPGAFDPFLGDQPIEHAMYVGHERFLGLPAAKQVHLRLTLASALPAAPTAVIWEMREGPSWRRLPATVSPEGSAQAYEVLLQDVPAVPVSEVAGRTSAWLRGRLATPLPSAGVILPAEWDREGNLIHPEIESIERRGLMPDVGFTGGVDANTGNLVELRLDRPFRPFGDDPLPAFYLAAEEVFSKPGAAVEIRIDLDPTQPPGSSVDLSVSWEYSLGRNRWKPILPAAGRAQSSTEQFLSSGIVTLSPPGDWQREVIQGVEALWLRISVRQGGFFAGGLRPPVVEHLTLSYTWPLPWIETLQMNIAISQPPTLTPELAFSNQLPLDLKKDFLPFGDKPRIGDAWYLASEEAFSKPGAAIELHVETTHPDDTPPQAEPRGLVLSWEFWDGEKWRTFSEAGLAVEDGTAAFVKTGVVRFPCPPALPVTINDVTRRWLRVRIARGGYGREAFYEEVSLATTAFAPMLLDSSAVLDTSTFRVSQASNAGVPFFLFRPPTFKPPSLRAIRLGYAYTSQEESPEHLLAANDFDVQEVSAGISGWPRLAAAEIFGRPAPPRAQFLTAAETARFSLPVFIPLATAFRPFVPSRDSRPALYLGFERPGDAAGFANRAVTLYFGFDEALYGEDSQGRADAAPPVLAWQFWNGADWQVLGVRDETRGFTRRGLVTFVGPAVFPASRRFDRTAHWLRVRWEEGDWRVSPRLRRVLTNTVWAVNAQTVVSEVLGSSRGERDQTFRTGRVPVLPGQRLEVREPEVPAAAERRALEREENEDAVRVVRDAAGHPVEVWVRWHEVPDFFGSDRRSRHYVLDRANGEVRFGDGRRGLVPPPGTGNVRMTAYRVGGGPAGNRPAGSIVQIKGTVPYVDGVIQHEPAEGGAPEESLHTALLLAPRRLRHRGRATALSDFEDLALEASPEVARALGIGPRSREEAGRVGLVIVPRSPSSKPIPGLGLLDLVRAHVETWLSPVVDLWVAGPDWLQVTVRTEIVPRVLEEAAEVQAAVRARIDGFLHPLTGGPDGAAGWAFGRKPHRSDLYAWIEATPGVDHVQSLQVEETPAEGGARPDRFLIFPGDHRISLAGSLDEPGDGGSPP
ncbi:MAG TPA: putative baseplate assembly protein [Thermoanaerobaculia bacterium]